MWMWTDSLLVGLSLARLWLIEPSPPRPSYGIERVLADQPSQGIAGQPSRQILPIRLCCDQLGLRYEGRWDRGDLGCFEALVYQANIVADPEIHGLPPLLLLALTTWLRLPA